MSRTPRAGRGQRVPQPAQKVGVDVVVDGGHDGGFVARVARRYARAGDGDWRDGCR